ncbi:hypothetical protein JR316_0012229 [Psilocybe cubensis]|uniref:DUF6535 domain-containing protein n=2 Tax=Psilocybe cubensis TaxID=181762 RepID=A0A8H7XP90_PSICU|nr:hypothetical protein JR316_0012229 [Psilocybe cubensis]KAH9475118.1 hypothetical protein JR316_0012229 [Psilocybe cubensis]
MPHPVAQNAAEGDKAWELKDDFKYAPKPPVGDPWKVLLDPLVEKEKHRCDAWNNEIQNLLIFAGLFSGLVTAFISQSYKTLQPDPNANLVSLLAIIAEGLNNSSSTAEKVASIATQPSSTFVPSSAAVRVNVCWFISLILSLTVILSGIIVMQWLREHQAFTGQSSRDKIAILNMRIEALDKWHVQDIITTFPLFLAIALVLFFAGMIDFLHMLGNKTVLVSVATVITISLVLLIFTTVLPALQCILLYIWLLPQAPPSPCPYKSPQSGLFHAVCYYTSDLLANHSQRFRDLGKKLSSLSKLNTENQHALSYLSKTWSKKTWAEIDLCWLSVRQACVCSETVDGYHKFLSHNDFPPLYDISKTFRDIVDGLRVAPEILTAAYHCFYELSSPFTPSNHPNRKRGAVERTELDSTFKLIVRRNQFLQSLMRPNVDASQPHHHDLSSNINFGKVTLRMEFHSYIAILHHQNMFLITDRLTNSYYAKEFHQHRVELGLRLADAFYSRWYHIEHNLQEPLPPYLKGDLFDQHRFRILRNDISVAVFQQYGHVLTTFFKGAADSHYDISPNCLLSHRGVAEFLEKAAWDTFRIMTTLSLENYSAEDRVKAITIFRTIMTQISSSLNTSPSTKHRQPKNPIYLLYLTGIYVRRINALRKQPGPCMDDAAVNELEATMSVMLVYKSNIVDIEEAGSTHDNAQLSKRRLNGKDRFGSVQRFSPDWWSFLEGKHDTNIKDSEASPFTRIWWEKRRPAPAVAPVTPVSTLPRQSSLHPSRGVIRSPPMRPSISTTTQGTLPVYSENDEIGPRTPRTASSMTASSSALAFSEIVHTKSDIQHSSEGPTAVDPGPKLTASSVQQSSVLRIDNFQSLSLSTLNSESLSHAPQQRTSVLSSTSSKEDKIEMLEIVPASAETLHPVLRSVTRTRTPVERVKFPDPIYDPRSLSDNPYPQNGDNRPSSPQT